MNARVGDFASTGTLLTFGLSLAVATGSACIDFSSLEIPDATAPDDGGANSDAGVDAGVDAGIDAGRDGGFDAGLDAGVDAGLDAGVDAGLDAGLDAGVDAGFDAGFFALDGGIFVEDWLELAHPNQQVGSFAVLAYDAEASTLYAGYGSGDVIRWTLADGEFVPAGSYATCTSGIYEDMQVLGGGRLIASSVQSYLLIDATGCVRVDRPGNRDDVPLGVSHHVEDELVFLLEPRANGETHLSIDARGDGGVPSQWIVLADGGGPAGKLRWFVGDGGSLGAIAASPDGTVTRVTLNGPTLSRQETIRLHDDEGQMPAAFAYVDGGPTLTPTRVVMAGDAPLELAAATTGTGSLNDLGPSAQVPTARGDAAFSAATDGDLDVVTGSGGLLGTRRSDGPVASTPAAWPRGGAFRSFVGADDGSLWGIGDDTVAHWASVTDRDAPPDFVNVAPNRYGGSAGVVRNDVLYVAADSLSYVRSNQTSGDLPQAARSVSLLVDGDASHLVAFSETLEITRWTFSADGVPQLQNVVGSSSVVVGPNAAAVVLVMPDTNPARDVVWVSAYDAAADAGNTILQLQRCVLSSSGGTVTAACDAVQSLDGLDDSGGEYDLAALGGRLAILDNQDLLVIDESDGGPLTRREVPTPSARDWLQSGGYAAMLGNGCAVVSDPQTRGVLVFDPASTTQAVATETRESWYALRRLNDVQLLAAGPGGATGILTFTASTSCPGSALLNERISGPRRTLRDLISVDIIDSTTVVVSDDDGRVWLVPNIP